MGIKGLAKFIADYAPKAVKQQEFCSFIGRTIAVDASMSLYQFMIAIRDTESYGTLTNEAGEATSHLAGFIARAIRLLENGIKPVYVFDGKPPTMKGGELAKRKDRRDKAEQELAAAREAGDMEEVKKQAGRTVKITQQHNADVKRLLSLMGFPVVDAPCEAEAQCAELTKTGKVYATATEDADALTFGSKVLIRHLNFSDSKTKQNPILALHLETVLEELGFTMSQFVDFCILCGCDYCDTIRGIGAKTAYSLIKDHKDIETAIQNIDVTKHPLPENFPFKEARQFFCSPEVMSGDIIKLQWRDVDADGLTAFLVQENNFNPNRVENYISRLRKARTKSSQMRLENFFGPVTAKASSVPKAKEETNENQRKNLVTKAGISKPSSAAVTPKKTSMSKRKATNASGHKDGRKGVAPSAVVKSTPGKASSDECSDGQNQRAGETDEDSNSTGGIRKKVKTEDSDGELDDVPF